MFTSVYQWFTNVYQCVLPVDVTLYSPSYTCPDCPSGAPGGSVCLSSHVLDYIIALSAHGPVIVSVEAILLPHWSVFRRPASGFSLPFIYD